MDQPPRQFPQAPLPGSFYVLLFAPVVCVAMAVALSYFTHDPTGNAVCAMIYILAIIAMIPCSIICSITVGSRSGGWLGLLSFFGIVVFYFAIAYGGCVSAAANSAP